MPGDLYRIVLFKGDVVMSEDMKKEKLLDALEKMLEGDEKYTVLNYFKNNPGVLLTAISLIAAFLVFGAKICSYLIASIQCRYWNLNEAFISEDNGAYIKLGVSILIIVIISASTGLTKKHAYLREVYDCQIYLYSRLEKQQRDEIKSIKKEFRAFAKGIDLAKKAERMLKDREEYPFKNGEVDALIYNSEQLKKRIKAVQKECRAIKPLKLKWRMINIRDLLISFLIILLSSFILQTSLGLNARSVIGIIQSGLLVSVILMAEVLLISWVSIKYKFRREINSFLKEEDITEDSELKEKIMKLLDSKANDIRNRDLKQYLSDKSCKDMVRFVLFYVVITLIFLPLVAQYNLCHTDTFYVTEKENQDYALVANYGDDYIFSQCDILDDDIFIDTNRIYVTKEPIKMEKKRFKMVVKR